MRPSCPAVEAVLPTGGTVNHRPEAQGCVHPSPPTAPPQAVRAAPKGRCGPHHFATATLHGLHRSSGPSQTVRCSPGNARSSRCLAPGPGPGTALGPPVPPVGAVRSVRCRQVRVVALVAGMYRLNAGSGATMSGGECLHGAPPARYLCIKYLISSPKFILTLGSPPSRPH